jgi:hypothetical protein
MSIGTREPQLLRRSRNLLTGIFPAFTAVVFASCLAAASDDASSSRACAALGSPSKLDYLVLASIADSPHLLAMASYRSTASQRIAGSEPRSGTDPDPVSVDN